MKPVYILGASRTPIGSLQGCNSTLSASELGGVVIKHLLEHNGIPKESISEVIMGQCLQAGQYQNPARRSSINAGIPNSVPAHTVNLVCASALKAVALGFQAISCGDSDIVIAGGQESMSLAPHCIYMRAGVKFGDVSAKDSMITDGLTDSMNNIHMGITAENVAEKFAVTRADQDEFAFHSQRKCAEASNQKLFDEEICPVTVKTRKGEIVVSKDEFPRPDTTVEGLSKLRPAFKPSDSGTVTAGNASGLNDAAAAVLLVNEENLKPGVTPLARIVSWAQVGVDPLIMGIAPVGAVRKALEKAKWELGDVDVFELNEAFAAQSVAVIRQLGVDPNKVNVNGGSIALGHPIGASGCRILVTLVHIMKQRNVRRGVAALCVGGGIGVAMCLERSLTT